VKKVNEYYIISINMEDIIDISDMTDRPTSNFGGGIELLMNNKIQGSGNQKSVNIGLDDLNELEKELNDYGNINTDTNFTHGSRSGHGVSFANATGSENINLDIQEEDNTPLDLGAATSSSKSHKTWDDYGKYNEIPQNTSSGNSMAQNKSKNEMQKEQFQMIRKLEDIEKKSNGKYQMSKKFTQETPYYEVLNEYEAVMEDGAKKSSIKFQGSCMKMLVTGIEFLNDKFDPFDVNLEGWGDKIEEDVNEYDEIFGGLYDKYKSKGSIALELKLMFMLGGSAFMVNLTNKIFKTAAPGMDEVLRQDPELMRAFQNAAVNTMSKNNPGIGNFMSGVVGGGGGPPPPRPTQGQYAEPPPLNRGGNNSRPDMQAARGVQGRESMSDRDRERRPPGPKYVPPEQQHRTNNNAINLALGDNAGEQPRKRPEMRGPSELGDLLSGIKTKTIEVSKALSSPTVLENDDNISIMSGDTALEEGKKTRKPRKPRSNKNNTVSLDL